MDRARVTRHVPGASMLETDLLSYADACAAEADEAYDQAAWLYVPPFYDEYRYVLGTRGERPLICIGLNPSTAKPGRLDNTLKSVERVAKYNGFDSFLMMNLYAQRATIPGQMDLESSAFLHQENLLAFEDLLKRTKTVWAAWGAVIETRGYLRGCMQDFVRVGQKAGAAWYTAGQRSKKGHPHHPLYLRKDSVFDPFDAAAYVASLDLL